MTLGHSNAHFSTDAHSPIERQADKAILGKASPQASVQKALRLLAAAAPLVYRRP